MTIDTCLWLGQPLLFVHTRAHGRTVPLRQSRVAVNLKLEPAGWLGGQPRLAWADFLPVRFTEATLCSIPAPTPTRKRLSVSWIRLGSAFRYNFSGFCCKEKAVTKVGYSATPLTDIRARAPSIDYDKPKLANMSEANATVEKLSAANLAGRSLRRAPSATVTDSPHNSLRAGTTLVSTRVLVGGLYRTPRSAVVRAVNPNASREVRRDCE